MDILPPCEFGSKCYRSNPTHFLEFSHPWGADGALEVIQTKTKPVTKRKAEEFVQEKEVVEEEEVQEDEEETYCPPEEEELVEEEEEEEEPVVFKKHRMNATKKQSDEFSEDDEPLISTTPKKAKTSFKQSPKQQTLSPLPVVVASEEKKEKSDSGAKMTDYLTDPEWRAALWKEFEKPYFKKIEEYVAKERRSMTVWPAENEVFAALNSTPLSKVKIVIIGQDPYFNPNQGHGLCFSVKKGIKRPPSLLRIYKEIERDYPKFVIPKHGFLQEWADRGILLLNATLTVQQGKANSHKDCGWQKFTDAVIQIVNSSLTGVVFLLWGGFAQKKGKIIDTKKHVVINGAHPSPLGGSAWIGCGHFKKANEALIKSGRAPVDWSISE